MLPEKEKQISMIFDTHAHYDDHAFDEDREELIASLADAGIGTVVNVAADRESVRTTLGLSEKYPFIWCALGFHPSSTGDMTEDDIRMLREALASPRAAAVGEIGLDYHWDEPDREVQRHWFARQLALAAETDMPVVIHSRDAAEDTMSMLKEHRRPSADRPAGVIHCYSYSAEQALQYVKMGYYIGIGGVLTFRNARKLKETAERLSLKDIVLETDCPYMAPTPHRGKRNSSLYLPLVVRALSEIKGVPEEEVIRVTEENARRLYGIQD